MPFFCYNKNDYCDHSENCEDCGVWAIGKGGKQVPSKADRIRAMSDEELAVFMKTKGTCPNETKHRGCVLSCGECWLEWLQQPAEGE